MAEAGVDGLPVALFAVGLVVSAVVGYVTVKYFVRYLAGNTLHVFAAYRLALAAATVAWLATRGA
jgi:undecaprenyl-diphosphatase